MFSHVSMFVKPFVKMSARCCFVLTYLMLTFPPFCITSYSHDKFTQCVL